MRVDIFVPTVSAEEQVQFYVHELQLFRVAHDYGMGSILLSHVAEPNVCLELMPGQTPSKERPLFCLSTDDCAQEFARMRSVSFTKGVEWLTGRSTKNGTYHWDDIMDPANPGRVMGHGPNNVDGAMPHLQIHELGGKVIHIFFPWGT